MKRLRDGAASLGLSLSSDQVEAFDRYKELLLEANCTVNLTRIVDSDAVETLHFLDSLSCWPALRSLPGPISVLDVGSGAGFPGVPLRIAVPELRLTLLDSLGKRTSFLRQLVEDLELSDVRVLTARAEDAGQDPGERERYDAVLARAVGPLPALLELTLPFLRVGGRLVAPRKGDLTAEIESAAWAASELGGDRPRIVSIGLEELADGRALVVVDKVSLTPSRYPRRAGTPARRPLMGRDS